MFENYTERARRVIFFARYETIQFGATMIGTEHLLLGAVRERPDLIKRLWGNPADIRTEVEKRVIIGDKVAPSIDLPLSKECKQILKYAQEESASLNHPALGVQHLLLGILREKDCLARVILTSRGMDLNDARQLVAQAPDFADELPVATSQIPERNNLRETPHQSSPKSRFARFKAAFWNW